MNLERTSSKDDSIATTYKMHLSRPGGTQYNVTSTSHISSSQPHLLNISHDRTMAGGDG